MERTVTAIGECDTVSSARITSISLGTGLAAAQLELPRGLFYDTLSEQSGFTIHDDGDLMELLLSLIHIWMRVPPGITPASPPLFCVW